MEEKDNSLSPLEQEKYRFIGILGGLLPPEIQERITNYEAASIMSTSSRRFNVLLGTYAIISSLVKLFGGDIDPTPNNILTWGGLGIAVDSFFREVLYGFYYHHNHPFVTYREPWGSFFLSEGYDSIKNLLDKNKVSNE